MIGEVSLLDTGHFYFLKLDDMLSVFFSKGVSKKWWKEEAIRSNWKVNTETITVVELPSGRYNVVMRKI